MKKESNAQVLANVSEELKQQLLFFSATSKTKMEFFNKVWAYDYPDSDDVILQMEKVLNEHKLEELRAFFVNI